MKRHIFILIIFLIEINSFICFDNNSFSYILKNKNQIKKNKNKNIGIESNSNKITKDGKNKIYLN
jgi:hypothetical protein